MSTLNTNLDGNYGKYDDEDATAWKIHYEPIVGIPVALNGHQVGVIRYESGFLNSGLYSNVFASGANVLFFPLFWGNLVYEMEASSADVLAGILYGLPAMG